MRERPANNLVWYVNWCINARLKLICGYAACIKLNKAVSVLLSRSIKIHLLYAQSLEEADSPTLIPPTAQPAAFVLESDVYIFLKVNTCSSLLWFLFCIESHGHTSLSASSTSSRLGRFLTQHTSIFLSCGNKIDTNFCFQVNSFLL